MHICNGVQDAGGLVGDRPHAARVATRITSASLVVAGSASGLGKIQGPEFHPPTLPGARCSLRESTHLANNSRLEPERSPKSPAS